MGKKHSRSRYQQLAMGFAASAFALLTVLTVQQYEANIVTAEVTRDAPVLTNYRSSRNCLAVKKGTRKVTNYRLCRPAAR
jgi:hypothetical protein